MREAVLIFFMKNPVFHFSRQAPAPAWRCQRSETQKEHKQRSAAGKDWPIFSSNVGKWSQERVYEPILMSQIASCADCEAQIDARSIHRATEDLGFAERGIFRSRRATAWERYLGWYWTHWNQVLPQDLSDLRPHRQDPGFASSWASWYHTLKKAGLSTFWCLPTSSKEVWSMWH